MVCRKVLADKLIMAKHRRVTMAAKTPICQATFFEMAGILGTLEVGGGCGCSRVSKPCSPMSDAEEPLSSGILNPSGVASRTCRGQSEDRHFGEKAYPDDQTLRREQCQWRVGMLYQRQSCTLPLTSSQLHR